MQPCSNASWQPASLLRLLSIACCAAMPLLPAPAVRAQQFDYDSNGGWKMPQPPAAKGEFGGDDPIGLASRKHIPTDCAINWQDEGGKTYCFSSAMSAQIFQDERASILPKAVAFWAEERKGRPNISDGLPTAPPPR